MLTDCPCELLPTDIFTVINLSNVFVSLLVSWWCILKLSSRHQRLSLDLQDVDFPLRLVHQLSQTFLCRITFPIVRARTDRRRTCPQQHLRQPVDFVLQNTDALFEICPLSRMVLSTVVPGAPRRSRRRNLLGDNGWGRQRFLCLCLVC